jgi:hypothetical protein
MVDLQNQLDSVKGPPCKTGIIMWLMDEYNLHAALEALLEDPVVGVCSA